MSIELLIKNYMFFILREPYMILWDQSRIPLKVTNFFPIHKFFSCTQYAQYLSIFGNIFQK